MEKPAECPTCQAPVTADHDWLTTSYHFDHWKHAEREGDVARLAEEVRLLRIGLNNARAHARRMVKGRQAAEDKLKAAGLLGSAQSAS